MKLLLGRRQADKTDDVLYDIGYYCKMKCTTSGPCNIFSAPHLGIIVTSAFNL